MLRVRQNNKHFRKVVPRVNKWWYRYIRGMSWFSFRYWWFNWLVFLGCIFLFWWFCPCNNTTTIKNCNINNNKHINDINSIIDSCCDCNSIIETPPVPEPPEPPENAINCDEESKSGGFEVQENIHYLGPAPGYVTIRYAMQTQPDKLEAFYNGELMCTTNTLVSGSGTLRFFYSPEEDQYTCLVRVTGGEDGTIWTYTLGCPEI